MSLVRNINLHDGFGNPISSLDGAIDVHDAHVHRQIINKIFSKSGASSTALASSATAGDTQIIVASATGFAVGTSIQVTNGTQENTYPSITAVVGTTLTLDRPLDYSYAIGDTVTTETINMAVVGSLGTPQSFKVQPLTGAVWHLTRILIEMTHTSAGDNGLFGNLAKLTNGVLIRRYDGATSSYATFTNWKDNSDIVTDMYDVLYVARSGGGGAYGTNARGSFDKAGAIVYLDGTAGDFLEILVQDDISSLTSFRIKAQGHIEGA